MTASAIFSWMLCGLIVGLIARFLVRVPLQFGLIMTMVLGIVGAVVGGVFFSLLQGVPGEPFSLSGNAWQGWVAAIIASAIVLLAWGAVYPKRWWQ